MPKWTHPTAHRQTAHWPFERSTPGQTEGHWMASLPMGQG
jgi:hypothetical protein